jgi:hypothetical protein
MRHISRQLLTCRFHSCQENHSSLLSKTKQFLIQELPPLWSPPKFLIQLWCCGPEHHNQTLSTTKVRSGAGPSTVWEWHPLWSRHWAGCRAWRSGLMVVRGGTDAAGLEAPGNILLALESGRVRHTPLRCGKLGSSGNDGWRNSGLTG